MSKRKNNTVLLDNENLPLEQPQNPWYGIIVANRANVSNELHNLSYKNYSTKGDDALIKFQRFTKDRLLIGPKKLW